MPRPPRKPFGGFQTLGVSGLQTTGLNRGEVDEEWSRDLKGRRAYRAYTEMVDNSPVVGAMLEYFETLMLEPEPVAEPSGDTSTHQAAADYLQSCIEDMSHTWRQFVLETATAWSQGWASMEIIYKQRLGLSPGVDEKGDPLPTSKHNDGLVGWKAIRLRGQDTLQEWEFNDRKDFTGWWQEQESGPPVFIPLPKTLHVRYKHIKNNPEGRSVLRSSRVTYGHAKNEAQWEGIALKRDAGGTIIMKAPIDLMRAKDADSVAFRKTLKEAAITLGVDQWRGGLLPHENDPQSGNPTGYGYDQLTSGQNIAAFNTAIVRNENRTAMGAFMQWLFMAMDRVGAHGTQKNSSDLAGKSIAGKNKHFYDLVNRHMVRPLMALSPFPERFWPVLGHTDVAIPTLEELGTFLSQVVPNVIQPDDELDAHARKRAGLPPRKDALAGFFGQQ